MIDVNHPDLSVRRQCALLGIARSGLYYDPKEPSEENLLLMRLLDEQYTRTPFYGVRRMTHWLHELGCGVDEKRVRRLLRLMGLEAIYPKPKLSEGGPEHRKFPYLLRGLAIRRPNQVWAADITYLRLRHGFAYLVAIMDWYSRYVLSWTCRTRWRLTSVRRYWRRRCAWAPQSSRTRTRGLSSQARTTSGSWSVPGSGSVWTGGAGSSTTSWWNSCGGP